MTVTTKTILDPTIAARYKKPMNSERIDRFQAIELLKKYSPDKDSLDHVLTHSERVSNYLLVLTSQLTSIDKKFLETAALLHDIGRFVYPPKSPKAICHGLAGGEILRQEWLLQHARVAECHIGIGISQQDIIKQNLPLPVRDFVPNTPEEMLITYADNLDVRGIKDEAFVEDRIAQELGPEYLARVKDFHRRIHNLLGHSV